MSAPSANIFERVRQRRGVRQFVKFGIVGASGFLVNLVIFTLLQHVVPNHTAAGPYYAIYSVAFLSGGVSNYFLNRIWTFRSTGHAGKEAAQQESFCEVQRDEIRREADDERDGSKRQDLEHDRYVRSKEHQLAGECLNHDRRQTLRLPAVRALGQHPCRARDRERADHPKQHVKAGTSACQRHYGQPGHDARRDHPRDRLHRRHTVRASS